MASGILPIHEIRLARVKATIWSGGDGEQPGVTFCRLYREADRLKSSLTFGPEDLRVLAQVASLARRWIQANGAAPKGDAVGER